MKIYLGSDHAGFDLKEKIKIYLSGLNQYEVQDLGAFSYVEDDDYPDYIKQVAEAVSKDSESFGLIFGGSGQGEAICANRFSNVRAVVFYAQKELINGVDSFEIIKLAREHNNANVLSIGARFVTEDEAKFASELFLKIEFSQEERHIRRIKKLEPRAYLYYMIEIIPAILPKDYEDMKNRIALVRSIIPIVQIDICDGLFVKNITWPFFGKAKQAGVFFENNLDQHFHAILNEEEGMPFWEDIDFELDLMVADAVQNFDIYTKLSPKRIVFHLEAVGNLDNFKNFLEGMDVYVRDAIQIGLAINTTTPIEKIFPLVNYVDFVQCMGIEKIGFQEQDFDKRVLSQIKSLKEKFPDLIISVDGGVSFKTAPILLQAGASRLISGSTIFKAEDIREIISELEYLDLN